MNYAEFEKRLDEGPPPIAVFVGDERFLQREALAAIGKCLENAPVVRLQGAETTPAQLQNEVWAQGLFSPRQIVVLDSADAFVSRWPDAPETWLENPPPASRLLLWAPKPKPRRKTDDTETEAPAGGKGPITDLFPAKPTQSCWVVRCDAPEELDRRRWATELAKREGKGLAAAAIPALLTACDDSLDALATAIAKCAAHAGKKTMIEAADVAALVTETPDPEAFALTNAIAAGNAREAFVILRRVIAREGNAQQTLGMLNWQVWQLYRVRRALDAGTSPGGMTAALAKFVHPSTVSLARRAEARQWRNVLAGLAESDRTLKTSSVDPGTILELGILRGLRPALASETHSW